jgi:hypothetical protein
MKVCKLSTPVAILLLFTGIASATGQSMQSVVSAEGNFTARIPGTVQRAQKLREFKDGKTATEYRYYSVLENDHIAYAVIYSDMPTKAEVGKEQYVLEKARDAVFSTDPGKKLLTDSSIVLNGVPGRAFTIRRGNGATYAARVFVKGYRLYQLVVSCDSGYTADQTKEFMESFQIK